MYIFEPIAVETVGVSNSSPFLLLNEIDRRISVNIVESRETGFLLQRASVVVQRFNAMPLTARDGRLVIVSIYLCF